MDGPIPVTLLLVAPRAMLAHSAARYCTVPAAREALLSLSSRFPHWEICSPGDPSVVGCMKGSSIVNLQKGGGCALAKG